MLYVLLDSAYDGFLYLQIIRNLVKHKTLAFLHSAIVRVCFVKNNE